MSASREELGAAAGLRVWGVRCGDVAHPQPSDPDPMDQNEGIRSEVGGLAGWGKRGGGEERLARN